MNTCALRSAANDGAWQPAAATGLPGGRSSCAGVARSGHQTSTKHWTLRCLLFRPGFSRPAAENSVGPRPASRVLVSSVLFQIA